VRACWVFSLSRGTSPPCWKNCARVFHHALCAFCFYSYLSRMYLLYLFWGFEACQRFARCAFSALFSLLSGRVLTSHAASTHTAAHFESSQEVLKELKNPKNKAKQTRWLLLPAQGLVSFLPQHLESLQPTLSQPLSPSQPTHADLLA
jgi:hypothetical protein